MAGIPLPGLRVKAKLAGVSANEGDIVEPVPSWKP